MGLTYFGEQFTQEQTAAILKPNPEDRNVSPDEMAAFVNEQTPYNALFRANGTVETLKTLLANDVPVIIETGINPPGEFRWLGWYGHYLLIVAYSDEEDSFWVYDSWFGTSEEPLTNAHLDGRVVSYENLAQDWSQFNRNYIAMFRPEQEALVKELIGQDMDDGAMWENALARSKQEIELDPGNTFYWFNLGTNYAALQQFEEAAVAFDQARAIGLPWRMLWYQFGPFESYLNTGRYEDVLLLADTTLEGRPYFEESYYFKGKALEAMGEKEAAIENLEKAVNFNPNYDPAKIALVGLK
jgi:tetratricopeptide (TPR) repeat protein